MTTLRLGIDVAALRQGITRLASRDRVTGRVSRCGAIRRNGSGWSISYTHLAGHGQPFPVGRRRPPPGPNEAPRSHRRGR